jgi:hypothetical protein
VKRGEEVERSLKRKMQHYEVIQVDLAQRIGKVSQKEEIIRNYEKKVNYVS